MQRSLILALLTAASIAGCATQRTDHAATPQATPAAAAPVAITAADILQRDAASDVVELAYSPRQRAVFVSAPDWKDESRSALLRLDPDTLAQQARIPLTGKGFGVALDDAADRLYLTQGFNGAISVVDTAGNRLIRQIPLMEKVNFAQAYAAQSFSQQRTDFLLAALKSFKITEDYPYKLREMVLDKTRGRLFAPGLGLGLDSVLFVVNTQTLALEAIIPGFGYNAVGIAMDEANGRVFVSNMQGQLMEVDAQTLKIRRVHEIAADQLLNLEYDPAGNRLFGVDQGVDRDSWRDNHLERAYAHRSEGNWVFVLDADSGRTLANLPTSPVPIGLRFDAQRQRLYVTNRGGLRVDEGQGALTIYDTAGYRLLQTLPMPPHPNSLGFGQDGKALYVTLKNDGNRRKAGELEQVVRVSLPAP